MNKREFYSYLKQELLGLPLEKQVAVLDKITGEYIPEFKQKILNGNLLCPNCNRYSPISKNYTSFQKDSKTEPTFVDAGYGDDDEYGENEYMVEYLTCPLCGEKREKGRTYLRTIWSRRVKE